MGMHILTVLIGGFGLLAPVQSGSRGPANFPVSTAEKEWVFQSRAEHCEGSGSNRHCFVEDQDSVSWARNGLDRYIKFAESPGRDYGIDLAWTSDIERSRITLRDQASTSGSPFSAITVGERIAISVDPRGYLKYERREYGINLVWSPRPVYEWEIRNGQANGSRLESGKPVGLYNHVENDYLVHCERPVRDQSSMVQGLP